VFVSAEYFRGGAVPDAGIILTWLSSFEKCPALASVSVDSTGATLEFVDEEGITEQQRACVLRILISNATAPMFDSEGRDRVSVEPRSTGSGLVIVSHNWCDPTSWYTESERITGEVLTTSDSLVFDSAYGNWIDLTHGKIYRENLLAPSYVPVVYIDGAAADERLPWASSGGDYSINYATGAVTFFASQVGKVITADYSHEDGSLFIVSPAAGKRLWIEYSEVQFSKDIDINAAINFQPWAYYVPPAKGPASNPTTYVTLDNFIEEANGSYPAIPAMGGTRGFLQDRLTFPFKYQTLKDLRSSIGVEIRVWIDGDAPYGGEYATATFYATSFTE